jgi:protein-S-isoprenylcysteine O-methyltransferase Ste14
MENKVFYILAALGIFTHIVRSAYEILKFNKKIRPGKLSFAVVFLNMVLLWISWFVLCIIDIYKINLPGIIRYAGFLICIVGMIVFLIALITIKTLESYEGDLITNGIYSKIRHPMYLGFIFWLIGFPVFQGAVFSFFLSFVFIANVLFWRKLEEKELEERFPGYPEYKKTTMF